MANEFDVLTELVAAFQLGRTRSDLLRDVEMAWESSDLPGEPRREEEVARAQLRVAVDTLREYVVTGRSLASLEDRWDQGYGFVNLNDLEASTDADRPQLTTEERHMIEELAALVAAIDEYLVAAGEDLDADR